MAATGRIQRTYLGRSVAARVAERRQLLVEAGVELVGRGGGGALTMRAVCRAVPLSPRYFYESFADRDALLRAVYDYALGEVRQAALAAARDSGGGLEQRARAVFVHVVALFERDPRLGRIIFHETFAEPALRKHGLDATFAFVGTIGAGLVGKRAERSVRTSARNELAVKAMAGALVALFLDWLEGRLAASKSELIDFSVRLTLAALRLSRRERPRARAAAARR